MSKRIYTAKDKKEEKKPPVFLTVSVPHDLMQRIIATRKSLGLRTDQELLRVAANKFCS